MSTVSHTGGCLTVRPDSALIVERPTSDLAGTVCIIFNRNEPSSIESGSREPVNRLWQGATRFMVREAITRHSASLACMILDATRSRQPM
jgi:hypothetical protein